MQTKLVYYFYSDNPKNIPNYNIDNTIDISNFYLIMQIILVI